MHECKLPLSIDFRHANIVKFLTGHSIWSKDAAAGARPEGPQPEARRSRSRLKATAGRALLGMEFAGPTYQPRDQRFLTVLATEIGLSSTNSVKSVLSRQAGHAGFVLQCGLTRLSGSVGTSQSE